MRADGRDEPVGSLSRGNPDAVEDRAELLLEPPLDPIPARLDDRRAQPEDLRGQGAVVGGRLALRGIRQDRLARTGGLRQPDVSVDHGFEDHLAEDLAQLRLDLPANAIGKDYRRWYELLAMAPSGTGFQISLLGLAALTIGLEEGIEFNLLSLSFGIDFRSPALRLPGIGRLDTGRSAASASKT